MLANHPLAGLLVRMRRVFLRPPIFDFNRDYTKAVFLSGIGRSGTTWVSNIINYDNSYRDMFEPFHGHYVYNSRNFVYPLYLRPDSADTRCLPQARRILTGDVWHHWIDQQNKRTFVERRLIKEIRANLWLKWLKTNFPELPIILLMRHPFAVADSRLALEWPTRLQQYVAQDELMEDHLNPFRDVLLGAQTQLEKHIAVWSLLHYVPLRQFRRGELHIVFYENFIAKPEEELDRLFAFLGRSYDGRVFETLKQMSFTTNLRAAPRSDPNLNLIDSWRKHIPQAHVARGMEILSRFGLDRIYGEDSLPDERGADRLLSA